MVADRDEGSCWLHVVWYLKWSSSASPILFPSHCVSTKIYPPIYPLWGIAFALVFDYTVSHDEPLVAVNG